MNEKMQGILAYQEVRRRRSVLPSQPSVKDLKNLIALAKRCSTSGDLEKNKRDEMTDTAKTLQALLKQQNRGKKKS